VSISIRERRTVSQAIAFLLVSLLIVSAVIAQFRSKGKERPIDPKRSNRVAIVESGTPWLRARIVPPGTVNARVDANHIEPGSCDAAKMHYEDAAKVLGVKETAGIGRLDTLLSLVGYEWLSAQDIVNLEPAVLMTPAELAKVPTVGSDKISGLLADDILATRFFSPKTTDVSGKHSPTEYSWRKLVRLRVRNGSAAAKANIANLWILTNTYEADLTKNPFETSNRNFQAILQPDKSVLSKLPMFFMVFGPLPNAELVDASSASWDAGDEALGNEIDTPYHPPVACAECHGRDTAFARLQYLDTDHWLDRVQSGDDFSMVGQSQWPALFDAGSDPESERYAKAFEVVKKLNQEIYQHNRGIDAIAQRISDDLSATSKSRTDAKAALKYRFQTSAAETWLSLHKDSNLHIQPKLRGILGQDGNTRWNSGNKDEVELVSTLNRFCFRCHSSVEYHVFDKESVREARKGFAYRLVEAETHSDMRMPQDRKADDPVFTMQKRQRILELLEIIFDRPQALTVLNKPVVSPQ
jgi:hypothetical protein